MEPDGAKHRIWISAGTGNRTEAARDLMNSWQSGRLSREDVRELIPDIWPYLDPPAGKFGPLTDDDWIQLFTAANFFISGPGITLDDPCILYRAAPENRVRGMSWCNSQTMAECFMPKHDRYGHYRLWSVAAPFESILAVLLRRSDSWRAGDCAREVVVNPRLLPEPHRLT